MAQSCNWIFTINNPENNDLPRQWGAKFCIWQLERGEEGTPHLQGYVMFASNKRLNAMKLLHPTAHWEIRRGTHDQAIDYNSKEETRVEGPWEIGVGPKQGKRSDLEAVKEAVDAGSSSLELFENFFPTMVKYHRGVMLYKDMKVPDRSVKTYATAIFGPTRSGKSTWMAANYANAFWPSNPGEHQKLWWDKYEDQETVIFDEFHSWIPLSLFQRLCDSTPLQVEVKGDTKKFRAKNVIFCSNLDPELWYHKAPIDVRPSIVARIDRIINKLSRDTYQIIKTTDPEELELGPNHIYNGDPKIVGSREENIQE